MKCKATILLLVGLNTFTFFAQISDRFPAELEALIKANFAQVKGKSLGYDQTLKGEAFKSELKITDFTVKAVEVSFTENFIIAAYNKKGDNAIMDDLFAKTMTIPYNHYDSQAQPQLLTTADKEAGIVRKIEIRKRYGTNVGTANLLATILLDTSGKISIRFTTKY
jgi:hypothetical protein